MNTVRAKFKVTQIIETQFSPDYRQMNTVRAKFKVTQIIETQFSPDYRQKKIVLEPQYDQAIAEDVSFQKATPTGRMEMQIDNPVAIERMPIGKVFYVDFTPVE